MDEKALASLDSRLDLELYIMGEMKYEFMSFLGECYKENFCETLSWGNFRRFQLTLIGKRKWVNIYFVLLKNEMTADVLINTFKSYEKRNSTLILYNAYDQKSKKAAETLQEQLITERNKFYEGILNENSIKKNLKKLSEEQSEFFSREEIDTENLKKNLKYLVDNQHTLINKIGLYSNQTNKKTKNVKKNDSNSSYEIDSAIFCLENEGEKCTFNEIVNFTIKDHFAKLRVKEKEYEQFLKVIVEYSTIKNFGDSNDTKKQANESLLNRILKSINWLILFYILVCFYNFLIN